MNPIVAVLLGSLFAGEKLTLRVTFAAVLIIGSVALVITRDQLKSARENRLAAAVTRAVEA